MYTGEWDNVLAILLGTKIPSKYWTGSNTKTLAL